MCAFAHGPAIELGNLLIPVIVINGLLPDALFLGEGAHIVGVEPKLPGIGSLSGGLGDRRQHTFGAVGERPALMVARHIAIIIVTLARAADGQILIERVRRIARRRQRRRHPACDITKGMARRDLRGGVELKVILKVMREARQI